MRVNDILSASLALMGEDADAAGGWQAQFTGVLNLLLAELTDAENSVRLAAGQPEMDAIPTVYSLADTVPYCEAICRRVLPFGAAGTLLAEDNPSLSSQYKNKYEYEKANAYKVAYTKIKDMAGEEE